MVLEVLQRLVGDIAEQRSERDFALLAAALYYIDDFPERCHHPKEDKYLFKAFDANDDPLFGVNQREEFRKLYSRIVNLLPSKIRMQMQRIHHEQ